MTLGQLKQHLALLASLDVSDGEEVLFSYADEDLQFIVETIAVEQDHETGAMYPRIYLEAID